MMLLSYSLILILYFPCIVYSNNNCIKKYYSSDIVPQIIDQAPEQLLQINFDGHEISCGEETPKPLTVNSPMLSFEAEDNSLNTLIMIDPDIPNPENPTLANFRHWVIVNIPGNRVQDGDVISEYVNPMPPKGSNPHRYILLVYRQSELESSEMLQDKKTNFSLDEYIRKHNIDNPFAGNFFYVQY
ncbi:protein D2-like [Parasteatoda tepidariorum]|uniref:protein D2-like n=1 Tax=Parasteatoda tepidariorum TaxID=114398 RepID=UPI001C71A6B0|nr:protein D2-like [Parasteatoda tepidariorum]